MWSKLPDCLATSSQIQIKILAEKMPELQQFGPKLLQIGGKIAKNYCIFLAKNSHIGSSDNDILGTITTSSDH